MFPYSDVFCPHAFTGIAYFGPIMENTSATDTSVFGAEHYLPVAPSGLRLANYLVDIILFYCIYLGAMFLIAMAVVYSSGDVESLNEFMDSGEGKLCNYAAAYAVLIIVYTLIEGASGGRSLGKLITGTVAVREDGSRITWRDALMRSLCRCIPFEPLSGFGGYPWHDKFTKTMVVRKRDIGQ